MKVLRLRSLRRRRREGFPFLFFSFFFSLLVCLPLIHVSSSFFSLTAALIFTLREKKKRAESPSTMMLTMISLLLSLSLRNQGRCGGEVGVEGARVCVIIIMPFLFSYISKLLVGFASEALAPPRGHSHDPPPKKPPYFLLYIPLTCFPAAVSASTTTALCGSLPSAGSWWWYRGRGGKHIPLPISFFCALFPS